MLFAKNKRRCFLRRSQFLTEHSANQFNLFNEIIRKRIFCLWYEPVSKTIKLIRVSYGVLELNEPTKNVSFKN